MPAFPLTETEIARRFSDRETFLDSLAEETIMNASTPHVLKAFGALPQDLRDGLHEKIAAANRCGKYAHHGYVLAISNFDCSNCTDNGVLKEAFDKLQEKSCHSLTSFQLTAENEQLRPFFDTLLKFTSLKKLSLPGFVFESEDFYRVSSKMAQLVSLECNLQPMFPMETFVAGLQRLKDLKNFIFDVKMEKTCRTTEQNQPNLFVVLSDPCEPYSRICVVLFPSLEVIGSKSSQNVVKYCHVLHHDVASGLRGTSSLKNLIVHRRMHPRQVEWHSENVRSLCVGNLQNDEDLEPLLHLKNVEELFFSGRPSKSMMAKMLEKFGPKLKSLACEIQQNILADEVFTHCPRLASLKTFNPFSTVPPESLTELHWGFSHHAKFYAGLFTLLTIPNLQKLLICFFSLAQVRLRGVITALGKTSLPVAPQLQSLKLEAQSSSVVTENTQAMIDLAQFICTKAPNLMEVRMPRPELETTFSFVNNRRIYN